MNQVSQKVRFQLTLTQIPTEASRETACKLIYGSSERDVMAALSTLPFTVGRSFSSEEAATLNHQFRLLKIHHRFLSPDSDATEFSFFGDESDSSARAREELTESYNISDIRRISQRKVPLRIATIALLALGLTGGAYWASQNFEMFKSQPVAATLPQTLQIGKLEKIQGDVRMRTPKSIEWIVANGEKPVFVDDEIETGSSGRATILFADGSRILIRENTQLKVNRPALLSLSEGSLVTQLSPRQRGEESLVLESQNWNLRFPYPKEQTSHIETTQAGNSLTVEVARGKAQVSSKQNPHQEVNLNSQQRIEASGTLSEPLPYLPTIDLIKPQSGESIQLNPNQIESIRFEWEGYPGVSSYRWELASDSEMKNSLLTQEVSDPSIELTYVDAGTLFWRVSGTWDGLVIQSAISNFEAKPARDEP